jgi:5-methylcytosine-specific restriction endonuclease McrA
VRPDSLGAFSFVGARFSASLFRSAGILPAFSFLCTLCAAISELSVSTFLLFLLAVNFTPSHTLDPNMKTKKLNAEHLWKQLDDLLVPRLRLGPIDRAAYSHLLRHSRIEGKLRVRFSIPWLTRGIRVSASATRLALRRLIDHGALRVVERSKAGHVVEVRLPEEILADLPPKVVTAGEPQQTNSQRIPLGPGVKLEEQDFLRAKTLRQSIHAREAGRCFYCLRLLAPHMKCLDHVLPRAQSGRNSYRNLVSCCLECNSRKGPCRAEDFLRSLFRERKLTDRELAGRLRALDALAAGKLPPSLPPAAAPETAAPGLCPRHPAKRHERAILTTRKENDKGSPVEARNGRAD